MEPKPSYRKSGVQRWTTATAYVAVADPEADANRASWEAAFAARDARREKLLEAGVPEECLECAQSGRIMRRCLEACQFGSR